VSFGNAGSWSIVLWTTSTEENNLSYATMYSPNLLTSPLPTLEGEKWCFRHVPTAEQTMMEGSIGRPTSWTIVLDVRIAKKKHSYDQLPSVNQPLSPLPIDGKMLLFWVNARRNDHEEWIFWKCHQCNNCDLDAGRNDQAIT